MRCSHCTRCCQDTQMELCKADIVRLERKGLKAEDFCSMGEDGIPRLLNKDGFCVLFNREKGRCSVYQARPLGCVIYPVNVSDEGELIIDELCPEGESITDEEFSEKGRRLLRLLDTIDAEASERKAR